MPVQLGFAHLAQYYGSSGSHEMGLAAVQFKGQRFGLPESDRVPVGSLVHGSKVHFQWYIHDIIVTSHSTAFASSQASIDSDLLLYCIARTADVNYYRLRQYIRTVRASFKIYLSSSLHIPNQSLAGIHAFGTTPRAPYPCFES